MTLSYAYIEPNTPPKDITLIEEPVEHSFEESDQDQQDPVLLQSMIRFKPFIDKYSFIPSNESGVIKFYRKDRFVAFENAILSQMPKGKFKYQGKVKITLKILGKNGFSGINLAYVFPLFEKSFLLSNTQIGHLNVVYEKPRHPEFTYLQIKVTKLTTQ